jgi:uncharacterized protein (DUF58 family)
LPNFVNYRVHLMLKRVSDFLNFGKTSSEPTQNDSAEALNTGCIGPYCSLKQLMALRWSVRYLNLPKAKRASRPQSGLHHSRFRGRGMEFSEVRMYQPGDDVRSIDWRVTARRQKPHTKLFNEERERPLLIVCDQSQSQFFGSHLTFKSVRAAETAALFAWTALDHNDRVGGIVYSEKGHQEVKPSRNRKSIMRLLNGISEFNQALNITEPKTEPSFHFNDALVETIRLTKPGTLLVIISDFRHINEDSEKLLTKLAKHNELLMLRTSDPIEQQLPPPGFYPVSNGNETLVIDSQSIEARKNYASWAAQQEEDLASLCIRLKAPYLDISTQEAPINTLQRMLLSVRNS